MVITAKKKKKKTKVIGIQEEASTFPQTMPLINIQEVISKRCRKIVTKRSQKNYEQIF